jgi:hypothetical protein
MRIAFGAALLLVSGVVPAGAEPISVVSVAYNIDAGPVTMMVVKYALDLDGRVIASAAQIKSHGISRVFAEYSARVTGESRDTGSAIAPVDFHLVRERDDKTRESRVTWKDGAIDYAPREKKPERRARVENALNAELADPMTAVLRIGTAGESPCPSVHQIFDARDVFELSLTDKGAGRLKSDGYRGPVRNCEVSWTPIAGRAAEKNEPRESYDVAFAQVGELPSGQALWLPVMLTGKLKGLPFKAYVTKLTIGQGAANAAASQQ